MRGAARDPKDDLLSAMVQAQDETGVLSRRELVDTAFLLVVAGHETTVHLICNGMLALPRHPEQLAALRENPAALPAAVEEFLRFDGPVSTSTLRFTTKPVTIGGTEIPEGRLVLVSFLSANRDAAQFANPEDRPAWRPGLLMHGLTSLPVRASAQESGR
ncbi:cytochrome P450 [Nonomuraea zeae]|uniref:cytochrome P450 n=1 Tax=Nonomuraea zeae TaxID=1642303 RepID=UPI00147833A6|nr:cytochrome P450 [Nonomuraea zeae]